MARLVSSTIAPMHPPRRSVFADRLTEFNAFAFGDDLAGVHRGKWHGFFHDRIGSIFDGRVVLEIGCADGALIGRLAAKYPRTAFVGLDWKYRSVFLAAERISQLGLRNVALLRGRGQDLPVMAGPAESDEILLFHPDPCATSIDRPNRLFSERFLLDAHHVLRPGGTLTLKTDHPGYFDAAQSMFGAKEPVHFAATRARAMADPATATRLLGEPRVRASDLTAPADRASPSAAAIERFTIAATSTHFWHDAAVLAHTAGRVFAGERSGFEERFIKKGQPIYYLELRKRQINSQK